MRQTGCHTDHSVAGGAFCSGSLAVKRPDSPGKAVPLAAWLDSADPLPKKLKTRSACPVSAPQRLTSPPPRALVAPVRVHVVDEDSRVESLLLQQAQQQPERQQLLIQHPDELSLLQLSHRVVLEPGQPPALQPGKLFDGTELTLILDVRQLGAQEMARFNDLLDPDRPCAFAPDKQALQPISAGVERLVLLGTGQLPGVQSGDAWNNPGADFWRRMASAAQLTLANQNIPVPPAPPLALPVCDPASQPEALVVPLHLHTDWQRCLFGGPGFDASGHLCPVPGVLARVTVGDSVILQGLDTGQLAVRHRLRQLQALGGFEANGRWQALTGVRLFLAPLTDGLEGELKRLADKIRWQPPADDRVLMINSVNLEAWLAPWTVNDQGLCAPGQSLQEQCAAGYSLLVSTALDESQWLRLLVRLTEPGLQNPAVAILQGTEQPQALGDRTSWAAPVAQAVSLLRVHNSDQLDQALRLLPSSCLRLQITAGTRLNQLIDRLHVISEQQARFARSVTPLHQALEQGRLVVLQGLETNPELQWQLESLLTGTPGLLVNGQWRSFPQACLQVLWPADKAACSPLWQAQLAVASDCEPVASRELACQRHGLAPGALPWEALCRIHQAASRLVDQPLPPLSGRLLDLLIRRALQAQQQDASALLQPAHWRQAVDSLLTHSTRGQPEVRDFLKQVCVWQLPDHDRSLWVDQDRLGAIIRAALPLSADFIARHRWALVRAFSPAVFCDGTLAFDGHDIELDEHLSALVCSLCPKPWQEPLQTLLAPDPGRMAQVHPDWWDSHSRQRLRRLEDALAAGWQLRSRVDCASRQIRLRALVAEIQRLAGYSDRAGARCELVQRLEQWLVCETAPASSLDPPRRRPAGRASGQHRQSSASPAPFAGAAGLVATGDH